MYSVANMHPRDRVAPTAEATADACRTHSASSVPWNDAGCIPMVYGWGGRKMTAVLVGINQQRLEGEICVQTDAECYSSDGEQQTG